MQHSQRNRSLRSCITAALLLTSAVIFLSACVSTLPFADAQETIIDPSWVQEGFIYELFVRDFTDEGTFNAIVPRLDDLKSAGVETIWLMPIHPIGELNRKGPLGSPYSIRDYYAVDPAYGNEEDFANLVSEVHSRDMHIILDLVVNHTAWDHPWISEHSDWYTRDASGNIVPPVADWTDVADLDFSNRALVDELINVMEFWVREYDIDGYRVDTASMVPFDFWKESIAAVQDLKPVLFLGESDDTGLVDAGFQLIYGWADYGSLKSSFNGGGASALVSAAARRTGDIEPGTYLRFTTNHDETAWDAAPPVLFDGQDGAMAAAVSMLFMPGVPLLYNGQEIGNSDSWEFFDSWSYDWDMNPETREFYRKAARIWQDSEALRLGEMQRILQSNGSAIVSYSRFSKNERVLVLVNIRDEVQEFSLPEDLQGDYLELFTGENMVTRGTLSFEPYEFAVLKID